jgi:hypothetical protein
MCGSDHFRLLRPLAILIAGIGLAVLALTPGRPPFITINNWRNDHKYGISTLYRSAVWHVQPSPLITQPSPNAFP